MTRAAAIVAVAALLSVVGRASATSGASDPIQGVWTITRGGTGTIAVVRAKGIFGVTAKSKVRLGCLRFKTRDLVGFVEFPSNTHLPTGVYSANFGAFGRGCSYAVRLRRTGGTLVGKVLSSEENQRGGPFTFRRA
jgi:hypothetical protein